jgi:hypothetical protein
MTSSFAHRTSDTLKAVLWMQLIIIPCLAGLFEDWWHVLEIYGAALAAFWSTVVLIRSRRPDGFTDRDVHFLWWGFFPFLFVFWLAARFYFVWRQFVA